MKRWIVLPVTLLLLVVLFMPAVNIHPHSQLADDIENAFPVSVSTFDIMVKGASALPTAHIPALSVLNFRGALFVWGSLLLLIAAFLCLSQRRGALQAAIVLSFIGLGMFLYQALYIGSLSGSLLFKLLLSPTPWLWVMVALAAVQTVLCALMIQPRDSLKLSDTLWRRVGGVMALLTVAFSLLPGMVSNVPDTITASPSDAQAMRGTTSVLSQALAEQPLLSARAVEHAVFENVLTGDLAALEPLSADGNNIRGLFMITKQTASPDILLLAALALLLIAGVLSFIPSVDRWFSLCLGAAGAVFLLIDAVSLISTSSADMFTTASRQLMYLGVGYPTVVPILMVLTSMGGCVCAALGVRAANAPYFVNPIPQKCVLRLTALALAAISAAMILLPGVQFSFYKPGKTKAVSSQTISGLQALTLSVPEDVTVPKDNKGKTMYKEEAKPDEYTASVIAQRMTRLARVYQITAILALALCLAGIACLVRKTHKKLPIALFLLALLARVIGYAVTAFGMPADVGTIGGTVYTFVSFPLLIFAAFFSNFAGLSELPKKFKLFLMMLPFLIAVFLFSYLPLYGWSYSLFDYKFGQPMSKQTFVGFKWFSELVVNAGHRANMTRVMGNTFAMSGLNILTSWMPMMFAILLNEVSKTRFKKFVQIFTTLPNFISWTLVFSFAMAMFAMDTGIYSKFMLGTGMISKPVAWLNSSEHIWIKMWGWSTWKGLGWGAIMYLAAISGIDQELYEAARVDGAGRWRLMRHITLPGLLPTFFVLLLLSISNIINNGMDQYLVFQNSMNKNTIEVLDLYVYNITIASTSANMYSFGTAIGILKTLFSVTLLFAANFASKKLRGESIV